MIEILIKDRVGDWVHAMNHDGLEEVLAFGWKGFDDYTDQELQEAIDELVEDNFDKKTAEKIKKEKITLELKRIRHLKYSLNYELEDKEKTLLKALGKKEAGDEFPIS